MKALILEDNASQAQSLQKILSGQGWQSHISHNWREASQWIEKNNFELLIMDILLPDKNGFEILEILPQKKDCSLFKTAIISGFTDEASVFKNIPPSINHCTFFKKPLDEKAFIDFLEELKGSKNKSGAFSDFFFEKNFHSKNLNFYFPENKTYESKELISLALLCHLKQFQGDLKIQIENQKESLIQFHKGNITQVSSINQESVFGTLLVEHGLSLSEDIEALLKDSTSEKPIGKRLVEKGLLSSHMLDFMLKEQFKIRLSEIMSHPSFTLQIMQKPNHKKEIPEIEFSQSDFTEWLSDSLQTELKEEFFEKLHMEIKSLPIRKLTQINEILAHQKKFLQDYNQLFKTLDEKQTLEDVLKNSEDKDHTLRLIYFGLMKKSIYLESQKKEILDFKKMEMILNSILKKDDKDLFAVLNLPWGASEKEVEKNYKQLLQEIHPDLIPENTKNHLLKTKAEKALLKTIKSYQTLKDKNKREKYMKEEKEDKFSSTINLYQEGLTQIKNEQYKESFATFSKIVNHNNAPSNVPLYILWARMKKNNFNLNENRNEAVQIQKALETCPISLRTSALFWFVKGLFCAQTDQLEKAQNLFKQTLDIQKDFNQAKRELVIVKHKLKQLQQRKGKGLLNLFKKSG